MTGFLITGQVLNLSGWSGFPQTWSTTGEWNYVEEKIPDITVKFDPKKNITAFDLARILKLADIGFDNDEWAEYPEDLKKHFQVLPKKKPGLDAKE